MYIWESCEWENSKCQVALTKRISSSLCGVHWLLCNTQIGDKNGIYSRKSIAACMFVRFFSSRGMLVTMVTVVSILH